MDYATHFGDLPVAPCGEPGDSPFVLNIPVTDDVARVQAALSAIENSRGRDSSAIATHLRDMSMDELREAVKNARCGEA